LLVDRGRDGRAVADAVEPVGVRSARLVDADAADHVADVRMLRVDAAVDDGDPQARPPSPGPAPANSRAETPPLRRASRARRSAAIAGSARLASRKRCEIRIVVRPFIKAS